MPRRKSFEIIFDEANKDDDLDSLLLTHDPRFMQLLDEARQRVRVTGGVSLAEFRQRLQNRISTSDDAGAITS